MRTLLIIAIGALSLFTAIGLLCAVRIACRPGPASRDPFFRPFGDMPGFSDQQLREMTRHTMTRIERDEQRRSFVYGNTHLANPRVTREMVEATELNSGPGRCPPAPDAGGVGHPHPSPRAHAVRNFLRRAVPS